MTMEDMTGRPAEFRPFWQSLSEGRISFPYCDSCARFHWYPLKRCPGCADPAYRWQPVNGPGRLFSWTVIRRAFAEEYASEVPYVVGLVEFDDAPGVRLLTGLEDTPLETLTIGMPVRPVIDNRSDPPRLAYRPDHHPRG